MRGLVAALLVAAAAAASDPQLDNIVKNLRALAQVPAADAASFDAQLAYNISMLTPGGCVASATSCNFTDLDYNLDTPAWWGSMFHIDRTLSFAIAYVSPASAWYGNTTLANIVVNLIQNWLDNDYGQGHWTNPGWWYVQVGVPDRLGRAALLVLELLSSSQLTRTAAITARAGMQLKPGCTDTNCVWLSSGMAFTALIEGNATLFNYSLRIVYGTMNVQAPYGGGINPDASFLMHGPLLYTGGYGMSFVNGIMNWLALTRGTIYALPTSDSAAWNAFSMGALDGSASMIVYGAEGRAGTPGQNGIYGYALWDVNAVGRDIARPYGQDWFWQAGQAVLFSPATVAGVGGPRADDFVSWAALLNGTLPAATPVLVAPGQRPPFSSGTRVYPFADYVIHRPLGPGGWTVATRSASSRNLRSEAINAENGAGGHLGDGALYTYLQGYEYADLPVAWNWGMVPGTTTLQYGIPGNAAVGGLGTTPFVGAATDGTAGVHAYDYSDAWKLGITYRRTVALFCDCYVLLVSNITTTGTAAALGAPAVTTIEQRRMLDPAVLSPSGSMVATDVYTSASPATALPPGTVNATLGADVWWVWQGGVGYIFPDRYPAAAARTAAAAGTAAASLPQLYVTAALQTGLWSKIGPHAGNMTFPIFALWAVHPNPLNASTPASLRALAVVAVPGISLQDFMAQAQGYADGTAVSVVSNTPAAQAALHAADGVLAASVYSPAGAVLEGDAAPGGPRRGYNVGVDAAGTYLVRYYPAPGGAKGLAVTVANPAHTAANVTVAIDVPGTVSPSAGPYGSLCAPGSAVTAAFPAIPSNGTSVTLLCTYA